MIVKHRRGTTQEWLEVDLIPKEGELVIEECPDGTLKCKIGNGYSKFSELPYIDDKTKSILLQEITTVKVDTDIKLSKLEKNFFANLSEVEQSLTNSITTKSKELTDDFINRDNALESKFNEQLDNTTQVLRNEAANAINTIEAALAVEKQERESSDSDNLAALAELQSTYEAKVEELEASDATIRNTFEKFNEQYTKDLAVLQQTDLDHKSKLEAFISSYDEKVIELESADTENNSNLNSFIEQHNNTISSLMEVDAENKFAIETIESSISNLEAEDNKINSAILELTETVSNMSDEFDRKLDASEDIFDSKLFEATTGLTGAIEALEKRLTGGGGDTSDGESLGSIIFEKTLNERLEPIETNVDEIDTKVEDLKSSSNLRFIDIQGAINELGKEVQNFDTTVPSKLEELKEEVADNKAIVDDAIISVDTQLNSINETVSNNSASIAENTKRINNILAPSDSTLTRDEEVIDIRVGYNGIDHASAGDAVRAVGKDLEALKASLPSYIPDNAVDGLYYENNQLWLTSKNEPVGEPVTITGGAGGSISVVKVTNNLATNVLTIAKGTEAWIDFTYTSFENGVSTGDGVYSIIINNKTIETLSGSIQHGVAKRLNVIEYLKNGSNSVKITCTDQYGSTRSLVYTISQIDLRIESTFNAAQIFSDDITFRYKVFGQIEKTAYVLVDGNEVSKKELSASVSGNETTLRIQNLTHGHHVIKAYVTASLVDGTPITSDALEYEIIYVEPDNSTAVLASNYHIEKVSQGDLISIPYMLYDPAKINSEVNLIIYSQVAGELVEVDKTALIVGRAQQLWNTRKYPTGVTIFTISYTYNLYGEQITISKSHRVEVSTLAVDVKPEEDSLQLYLTAQGRSNNELNPAVWEFTQVPDGDKTYGTITTTFEGFNWKSNGWCQDDAGDTCLRLNGEARATINFKPFENDFKANGKTIEFEFTVRDVNDRDAIVIDCFEAELDPSTGEETGKGIGFRATPDTAFLKSRGSEVSCRYKDEERVRVAITVEHAETTSHFVSIYLDGVLSGVQRYATTDIFSQDKPLAITLGSSFCGLDIYNIRVYDKALETAMVLNNYIADQTIPATRLQLMTDNDILDENGNISYDRVKALGQIPIITFTGPMPTYKGDKKKKTTRMKFEDPINPEMNFDVLLDQIDVQGTSSQFYVRKNWKVKLPEARAHIPGAIPAKVFCIKVDYAEATGTHNTGSANYIETLYDREEVTLPPQKDDTRVRTTIQGFPIIIFEKETEDAEPVFSSKGNFNYDKDAENAFGFTEEYKDYGVECWEFCNNTSDPVNFAGEIADEWLEDFEPRYVPESANFARIEALQENAELAASGKGTMTEAQKNELATLMRNCIANFKEMHDWVLSTATYTLSGGKRVPITPIALDEPVTYGETTYHEDNEEYRLAKFKYEFKNYFNMHYSSMYYVFTFFALMTDQRAKNLFLTRWKEEDGVYRWYPYFYDNDTIFGINNEGALVFDYFHEDADQLGSSNVFNGQNSVLWHNFRLCFPQEIQNTYSELRSSGKLTYNKIIDQFITQGSESWSEAIYNADADYKYVSMARGHVDHTDSEGNQVTGVDSSNLYQVRGTGEQHLRYFIDNRLNYCDSKWNSGDYPSNFFFLRIYTPSTIITDVAAENKTDAELIAEFGEEQVRIYKSLKAVPACPNIKVTPFSAMYAGVRYKSGTLQQERLSAGEDHTFTPINTAETFGDTETAIYGASELASLGDLSGLYCGVVNLKGQNTGNTSATQGTVKENKLIELIIGNSNPDYYNDNFREIAVGTCKLLKTIDLRNCAGLGVAGENPQKTLELSGCPNIEHIYTEGTNLTSIDLPDSGYIKTLHLPKSINTLVIRNQKNISEFIIENDNYSNIKILCIENSNLNTNEILDKCRDADDKYTVERVRLTDIEWGNADEPLINAEFITSLFPVYDEEGKLISGVRGIDENNNPLADAYLVGTCYIDKLTGKEYTEINRHYPYLDINYNEMTSDIIFMSTDGETELYRETITSYNSTPENCDDPVLTNKIIEPTKETTDEFVYTWNGWTRTLGDNAHLDALINITGNRVLYPAFEAHRRTYTVTFVNPTAPIGKQILKEIITPYGETANYYDPYSNIEDFVANGGKLPLKLDVANSDLYEFKGWYPTPENIVGDLTCYAQFTILDSVWYTVTINDFGEYIESDNYYIGHEINSDSKEIYLTKYNNKYNAAVSIPTDMKIDEENYYSVVRVGGFNKHSELELVQLPSELKELLPNAFAECINLSEVLLPDSLELIGDYAFKECKKLKDFRIPFNVRSIGDAPLAKCSNVNSIEVADGNTDFIVLGNCLIDIKNKELLQGLANSIIPDSGITKLSPYCFANMDIEKVRVPEGVTIIPDNAFSNCKKLTSISLPKTLKTLDATSFAWCNELSEVNLPENLEEIRTYVFDNCKLSEVTIPAKVTKVYEKAFGDITSLKKVTFKKASDGKIPYIHPRAFVGSGDQNNPIVFNFPWSEDEHRRAFDKIPGEEDTQDRDPFFGALGYGDPGYGYDNINFNYVEDN